MAKIIEGDFWYTNDYVIEQDGTLYGPFGGQVSAHTFALERLEPPYTLRELLTPVTSNEESASK